MNLLLRAYNKYKVDLRERLNPFFAERRSRKLKDCNFSIISNNCWGGHVYRFFGLPYNTPTIGLFFFAHDYVKFVYDLKGYLSLPLEFIPHEQSRYHTTLLEYGGECATCPIAKLDDIEVIFMHYANEEEAKVKWERRVKRLNWDNLVFKMSEMNGCTIDDLRSFDKLNASKKCVFVSKDYGLRSQVIFRGYKGKGNIDNDTDDFRKYINLYDLIDGRFNQSENEK